MATINPNDPAGMLNQFARNLGLAEEKIVALDRAAERAGTNLQEFSRSFANPAQSMAKYNSAILGTTKTIGDLASNFGFFGKALGGVVKLFGNVTASILEQNDAYLKAKDSLNQFGFSSQMTASEIAAMGREAGYTKAELEKYTGAMTSLGTDMLTLGQTFGKGAESFMKNVANVGLSTVAEFGKMGVSQEQLTKSQAQYIKLMGIQGVQITDQMKTSGELRKGSLEYTKNLLQLAALSGEDVENIKRKQEAASADINFQLGQAMKQREIAQLEEQTDNAEAQARAKQLKDEFKANEKLRDMAIQAGLVGQDLSAFLQMIQTGTFTELSAKFAPFGSELLEFIANVQKTGKGAELLPLKLAQITQRTMDTVGKAATLSAAELQAVVFLDTEQIKRQARLRGMSEEEYLKLAKETREKLEENAKKDPLTEARAKQFKIETAARIAYESMTEFLRGPLMKALDMFQNAIMWVGRGLLKTFGWLTGVDEDTRNKLIDALTPLSELEEQLAKINKRQSEIANTPAPEDRQGQYKRAQELRYLDKEKAELESKIAVKKAEPGYQGPQGSQGTTSSSSGSGPIRMTQEELRKKFPGVIRPTGDVHLAEGGEIDYRIYAVLSRLGGQDWFQPGGVTSVNDSFHQGMNSKHVRGQAIDFKVREYNENVLAAVKSFVNDIPGATLRDEYANPSANATGKHFHLEVGARRGMMPGMFDAPTSGTLMAVHNREMIAPLDPNSIIAKLLTASPSEAQEIMNAATGGDVAQMVVAGFGELGDKLDALISGISSLNNTQEEALMYTRT